MEGNENNAESEKGKRREKERISLVCSFFSF